MAFAETSGQRVMSPRGNWPDVTIVEGKRESGLDELIVHPLPLTNEGEEREQLLQLLAAIE